MERLLGIETGDSSRMGEQTWSEINANIIDFVDGIDPNRQCRVYYEDLVRDSESVMQNLCSFLGLPFEKTLLQPYTGNRMTGGLHTGSIGIGDPNFLNHKTIDASLADAWKTVSLDRKPGGFMRRIARELDYELPEKETTGPTAKDVEAQPSNVNVPALVPVSRSVEIPLSFQQERLWFLMQLEPENLAYNLYGLTFRLQGNLNVDALQRSLDEVTSRHEILRTTFHEVGGKPTQVIQAPGSATLKCIDLINEPDNSREERAYVFIQEEIKKQFILEKGPLFKAVLISLKADDHILCFPAHHTIFDGWSFSILIRELATTYNAYCASQVPDFQALPVQYADFAIWQRKWLQGAIYNRLLDFWKRQLGDDIPKLQLPTDRPRPSVQTYSGEKLYFSISSDMTKALRHLGNDQGGTLFMTLLAAFKCLLYRYTGQVDFAVGSPTANRNRAELEDLIGFFVNNLVLRTNLAGNPSFAELLKRVRKVTLDAYDHQDLPFERVVEELRPERDLSYSPLFQIMFVLQNLPLKSEQFSQLSLHQVPVDTGISMFDLTLFLWEEDGGLSGKFEYNTDLFDKETIKRLETHYQTLLSSIVSNPNLCLSDLPLLPEEERHRLLVEWNDTRKAYPTDKTLVHLFEEQVEHSPDAIAVTYEGTELTYSQLNARANQLAHRLISMGVGPEILVGLFMERSIEMVVGIYGIIKAGGAYVPIDPEYPSDRLAFIIEDTSVPVILTQKHLAGQLTGNAATLLLDTDWEQISGESEVNPPHRAAPENIAYVIYTSGSTGRPKGVMNEHRGIVNRLIWMQDEYQLTSEDRILQKTPYSFDVSVWEFFWPLIYGARLIVAKPGGHRDSSYLIGFIREHQITTLHFVPSMLHLFLETRGVEQCSSIKRVICSGEALSYELQSRFFERFNIELHNLYGPTEAAVDVTYWACRQDSERNIVPIGFPVANTQMYILDPLLRPVPTGCTGELHIGGIQVARGYLNRPELTAEKFIPDPFNTDPDARLYKTGDLARYLPDGSIDYLGRIDFQVKIRGLRVELGEIEAHLSALEEVSKCVVLMREDEPGDQRLVAYYTPSDGQKISISAMRDQIQEKVPQYMVPSNFMELGTLPLLSNGKVNRKALPAPDKVQIERTGPYMAPRSGTEQAISDIWRSVLKLDKVGVNDNFFDIGGHSLLMAQVANKLQAILEKDIPLVTLFQYPTIASLAAYFVDDSKKRSKLQDIQAHAEKQKSVINRQKALAKRRKSQ